MVDSTLNDPVEVVNPVAHGHSTEDLGPSDSSDSGSDVRGAVRRPSEIEDPLDNHPLDEGNAALQSDTDRYGTGERASADGDGSLQLDDDLLPERRDEVNDVVDAATLESDTDDEADLDDLDLTDGDAVSDINGNTAPAGRGERS